MSELKAMKFFEAVPTSKEGFYQPGAFVDGYLKSEADKVIAELIEKNERLSDDCLIKASNTFREIEKEIRRHKYKRCLAMARWCEATALWCYQAANTLPAGFHATLYGKPVMIEPARLFKRHVLLTKWSARWSEIADKFKEVK